MILLDEIEDEPKEKREATLPPYSPRRSFELPPRRVPLTNSVFTESQHSRTVSLPHSPRDLPRLRADSIDNASVMAPVFQVPNVPLSAPSSNASQASLPRSAALGTLTHPALHTQSSKAPLNICSANYVYIERNIASITGSFIIDPTLHVPAFLLPDEGDMSYINERKGSKGNGKKSNLNFLTNSGDICADVWIYRDCSQSQKCETRYQCNDRGTSHSNEDDKEVELRKGLLPSGTALQRPRRSHGPADIDVWSDSGSIMLRMYAAADQGVRIRIHAGRGSISVGIPRSFLGHIYVRNPNLKPDPAESTNSNAATTTGGQSMKISNLSMPNLLGERGKYSPGGLADWEANLMGLKTASRQPVQFSKEMDGIVEAQLERRRDMDSQYLFGHNAKRLIDGFKGELVFDELYIEGCPGAIDVFFNDEPHVQRSGGLISKLLNRHGTLR